MSYANTWTSFFNQSEHMGFFCLRYISKLYIVITYNIESTVLCIGILEWKWESCLARLSESYHYFDFLCLVGCLQSLNAKTGLFSKHMKNLHRDPKLHAQRVAAIKVCNLKTFVCITKWWLLIQILFTLKQYNKLIQFHWNLCFHVYLTPVGYLKLF